MAAMGEGFIVALLKSFGVILASEIGDKTFFIAAIMAMRHPRAQVRWGGGGRRWPALQRSGTCTGGSGTSSGQLLALPCAALKGADAHAQSC